MSLTTRSNGPVDSITTPFDSEGWLGMDSQEVARQWGQLAHVPRPPIPDLDTGRWEWLQQGILPDSEFFLYKEFTNAPFEVMQLLEIITVPSAWGAPVPVAKARYTCRYKKGKTLTLWPGSAALFMEFKSGEEPLEDAAEKWEAARFIKAAFDRHFPDVPAPQPAPARKPKPAKPKQRRRCM